MNAMPQVTTNSLIDLLDGLYSQYSSLIDQVNLETPAPTTSAWTPRQVLSHVIGSLQRVPLLAGYFLAGASSVPVIYNDPYWIPEWDNAPKDAFRAGLQSAVEGNKAFINSLTPDTFWRAMTLPIYGDTPLAIFMMANYSNHILEQHIPQLKAFVA